MKKLVLLILLVVFGLWVFTAFSYADPGDETTTDNSGVIITDPNYPPPPDGYVGIWPPPDPDMLTDSGNPPPPDGEDGDDGSWGDPNE